MSSIGPQMPPSKRKSPPSASASPPAKRIANEAEIDLSDSDDGFGPQAPNTNPASNANKDEIDLSSEDDTGPAPPQAPAPQEHPEDDSSSEDDYGPSLPTASTKARIGPSLPPSNPEEDNAPKRDNWMLAPPPSGPLSINDPSKISARNFSSSKAPKADKSGDNSIWTETPEEKLARLQASVLGKAAPASAFSSKTKAQPKTKEEDYGRIKENFEAARGKSMVEEARERRGRGGGKATDEEGDDDPSKRGFDREKDMAIGGRFGGKERRELMESAKDKSRFSKGTFL